MIIVTIAVPARDQSDDLDVVAQLTELAAQVGGEVLQAQRVLEDEGDLDIADARPIGGWR